MCGLLGYIGSSKDYKKTQLLTTSLFKHTQIRGIDASGYYCTSEFEDKKVFYHKQVGNSSELISSDVYKRIWDQKSNLGLFHCRAASIGVGSPSINKNNHPFVSKSFKKSIIHNGLISKNEYNYLKNFYETETDCDSEIVLRILEQDDRPLLENIGSFLSHAQNSQFAIAYAEAHAKARKLVLFRNDYRPLYYADLRNTLGQIFFFSTLEIFLQALEDMKNDGIYLMPSKIVDIKPYNIFEFTYNQGNEINKTVYQAKKTNDLNSIDNTYKILECKNTEFTKDNCDSIDYNMETNLISGLVESYNSIKNCENKIRRLINLKALNKKQYKFAYEGLNKIILSCNYIIDVLEGKNNEL